jgi:cold-inducible RNA-binding protein
MGDAAFPSKEGYHKRAAVRCRLTASLPALSSIVRSRLAPLVLICPRGSQSMKEYALKNIYVGNISFQTTEQELDAAFSAYGQVERVQIIKDRDTGQARGFAFVEMPVNADADKAMAALNGAELGGRTITVNEARPREARAGGRPVGGGGRPGGGGGNRPPRREPRW